MSDMEPATYAIKIYQGKTFSLSMTWKDGSGAVIDLTLYAARMTVRKKLGGTAVIGLSVGSGIVVAATSPNIVVTMTATQTAAMDFGIGIYDLEVQSPSGIVYGLLEGPVELVKEIST